MKDTKKILRHAIFDALNGTVLVNAVAVPVKEEKMPSTNRPPIFILLLNQQESPIERNGSTWITQSSIDIDIEHKQGSEVNKDVIDNVCEQILEIIFPSIGVVGLTIPTGFQFQEGFRESCFTQLVSASETEIVIIERIKLTFIITQQ